MSLMQGDIHHHQQHKQQQQSFVLYNFGLSSICNGWQYKKMWSAQRFPPLIYNMSVSQQFFTVSSLFKVILYLIWWPPLHRSQNICYHCVKYEHFGHLSLRCGCKAESWPEELTLSHVFVVRLFGTEEVSWRRE